MCMYVCVHACTCVCLTDLLYSHGKFYVPSKLNQHNRSHILLFICVLTIKQAEDPCMLINIRTDL